MRWDAAVERGGKPTAAELAAENFAVTALYIALQPTRIVPRWL